MLQITIQACSLMVQCQNWWSKGYWFVSHLEHLVFQFFHFISDTWCIGIGPNACTWISNNNPWQHGSAYQVLPCGNRWLPCGINPLPYKIMTQVVWHGGRLCFWWLCEQGSIPFVLHFPHFFSFFPLPACNSLIDVRPIGAYDSLIDVRPIGNGKTTRMNQLNHV